MVIAGAGTGKTRVIVERVRHLLETAPGPPARAPPRPDLQRQGGRGAPHEDRADRRRGDGRPHDDQQLPQLLPADPDRACRRRRAAGSPRCPRRRRPAPAAPRHHAGPRAALPHDRLLDAGQRSSASSRAARTSWSRPTDFDAYVASERRVFEERYGDFEAAVGRLAIQGNLEPLRKVRADDTKLRALRTEPRTAARSRPTTRKPRTRRPTARPAARSPATDAHVTSTASTRRTRSTSASSRRATWSMARRSKSWPEHALSIALGPLGDVVAARMARRADLGEPSG